jgi:hydrogenase expression/formation protein HypC
MCLSVPARVISIDGDIAKVAVGETICNASLQIVDDIKVGDYILLHTGFALQKLSKEEAEETFRLFEELEDINKLLDAEEENQGA